MCTMINSTLDSKLPLQLGTYNSYGAPKKLSPTLNLMY